MSRAAGEILTERLFAVRPVLKVSCLVACIGEACMANRMAGCYADDKNGWWLGVMLDAGYSAEGAVGQDLARDARSCEQGRMCGSWGRVID